jgi:drug/metabolite transporter (DMT)-like permease
MMFSLNPYVYVFVGILATSTAQVLLKLGSKHQVFSFSWVLFLSTSLFVYSTAFLFYYMALRSFEISKLSPIMMASTVSLVAICGFALGEQISLLKIVGIALSILSVFIIANS